MFIPSALPSYTSLSPTQKADLANLSKEAEEIFQTSSDEYQAEIDNNRIPFLQKVNSNALFIIPEVGTSVIFPSTKEDARLFLDGQLTEEDVYQRSILLSPNEVTALYLAMVYVRKAYRNQGLGMSLITKHIEAMDPAHEAQIFSWAYSLEGKHMLAELTKIFPERIRYIVDSGI